MLFSVLESALIVATIHMKMQLDLALTDKTPFILLSHQPRSKIPMLGRPLN
jgi:hypothetical protein